VLDSEALRLSSALAVGALLCAPSLRLLTRSGEERLVGLFFLASGVGFAFRLVAQGLGEVHLVVNGVGHLGLSLGCIALYRFTRVVFRPDSRIARLAELVGISASAITLLVVLVTDGNEKEQSLTVMAANAVRFASYAWSFGEAIRYWRMMRRRAALGLSDSLVANRFALWSVWMGGLTAMLGGVLCLRVVAWALDADPSMLPRVLPLIRLLLAALGLVSGTSIWLTFFPPARYVAWLRRAAS